MSNLDFFHAFDCSTRLKYSAAISSIDLVKCRVIKPAITTPSKGSISINFIRYSRNRSSDLGTFIMDTLPPEGISSRMDMTFRLSNDIQLVEALRKIDCL